MNKVENYRRHSAIIPAIAVLFSILSWNSQVVAAGSHRSLADLPKLLWSTQSFQNLSWGMAPNQVDAAIGVRLRLAASYPGGQSDYACDNCTAMFLGQRVKLDFPAFSFVRGKLYLISFSAFPGHQDELMRALFAQFGPARFEPESNSPGPELTQGPRESNRPQIYQGVGDPKNGTNYQWYDDRTAVDVSASYTYSYAVKRTAWWVGGWLIGWAVAERTPGILGSRNYRSEAENYLHLRESNTHSQ